MTQAGVLNVDRQTNPFGCVHQSLFKVSDSAESMQLTRINDGTDIDFRECSNNATYTAPTKYMCSKSKGGSVLTCKDPSQCYSIVLTSLLSGSATRLKDPAVSKRCATKYEWHVNYPSCNRGYWTSGCGQPAMKQKGAAKCYGHDLAAGKTWVVDDAKCTGKKPDATRTCPATPKCRE